MLYFSITKGDIKNLIFPLLKHVRNEIFTSFNLTYLPYYQRRKS